MLLLLLLALAGWRQSALPHGSSKPQTRGAYVAWRGGALPGVVVALASACKAAMRGGRSTSGCVDQLAVTLALADAAGQAIGMAPLQPRRSRLPAPFCYEKHRSAGASQQEMVSSLLAMAHATGFQSSSARGGKAAVASHDPQMGSGPRATTLGGLADSFVAEARARDDSRRRGPARRGRTSNAPRGKACWGAPRQSSSCASRSKSESSVSPARAIRSTSLRQVTQSPTESLRLLKRWHMMARRRSRG